MPISIRVWYENITSVCLMGSHPQLSWMDSSSNNQPNQPKLLSDPLVIFSLDDVIEAVKEQLVLERSPGESIWIPLSPGYLHKADLSGGGPYTINIPSPGFDINFNIENENIEFINYLRTAILDWGGFPRLAKYNKIPQELNFIKQDLQAF